MKKITILLIAALVAMTSYAQTQKDVTQFLGIPVDGSKSEMIQKLKTKGFTSTSYDKDVLKGEFNGASVDIHIVTNNNKVYRIMVSDANGINEANIKIRFNNLCQQFQDNKKYISLSDYSISDDENISYEMNVENKRYQASFYQDANTFTEASNKSVWFMISEYLGKYYITMYYDNKYNEANGDDL